MKKTNKTPKQKRNQRITLALIVIILLVIIFYRMRNKGSKTETIPGTSTTYTAPSNPLPKLGNNATLKYGTKAQEVQWIQSYYNEKIAVPLKKTKLAVDGIFGSKTQAAVKSVTGTTSTSWTVFKQTIDGTAPAPTASIYANDWQNTENQWQWATQ